MVDKAVVLRKLSELGTYYGQIKEFADITIDNYKNDWKTQRIDVSCKTPPAFSIFGDDFPSLWI